MGLALKAAENGTKIRQVPIGCVSCSTRGIATPATALCRPRSDRACRDSGDPGGTKVVGSEGWSVGPYVTLERARCAPARSRWRDPAAVLRAADPKGGAVESGVRFLRHRPAIMCRRFIRPSARAKRDAAAGFFQGATVE